MNQQHKDHAAALEDLRRSFVVGRPTEVEHTALSAVAFAHAELTRVEMALKDRGIEARVQVLVCATDGKTWSQFDVDHSPLKATAAINGLANLNGKILGLLYLVVDLQTKDFELWTKAFVKGRQTEKILDVAVAKAYGELAQ